MEKCSAKREQSEQREQKIFMTGLVSLASLLSYFSSFLFIYGFDKDGEERRRIRHKNQVINNSPAKVAEEKHPRRLPSHAIRCLVGRSVARLGPLEDSGSQSEELRVQNWLA